MGISKVVTQKLRVYTAMDHILTMKSACGQPLKCMERNAIFDALEKIGISPKRLRVDAGQVNGIWGGYRWRADTPKAARDALLQWDEDLRNGREPSVEPHSYGVTFRRLSKVQKCAPFTPARRAQINAARKAREAAKGTSDHKRYSRVIGHTYL